MNAKITWPMAAIIIAFLSAVVLMAVLKTDAAALIAVGSLILGGMGFTIAQQQQIKDNTNGNNTALLEGLRELARVVAVSHPVAPEVIAEITAASAHKPVSAPPALAPLVPLDLPSRDPMADTAPLEWSGRP